MAKLCSKFYQVPPGQLIQDIVTIFSSTSDEDMDARWSPMFIATFLEFLTSLLSEPPRSLQHQCRMKVRSCIGYPLPLRLAFLNVPLEIKDYLLMRPELSEGVQEDPETPNPVQDQNNENNANAT